MHPLHESHSLPTTENAQRLWFGQQADWDCWLASLRMALRFWEVDYTYEKLLSQLLGTSLLISEDYGGFFPYAAFVASRLGFGGYLRCSMKNLPELAALLQEIGRFKEHGQHVQLKHIAPHLLEKLARQTKAPRSYLYRSLFLLTKTLFEKTCTIYQIPGRPSFQEDILCLLEQGLPVIVRVNSDEFYQIPGDDSGHLLTFIPVSDGRGYVILDSYRERGYQEVGEIWKQYLHASNSYDWSKWSDWLLAIQPLELGYNHRHRPTSACT